MQHVKVQFDKLANLTDIMMHKCCYKQRLQSNQQDGRRCGNTVIASKCEVLCENNEDWFFFCV